MAWQRDDNLDKSSVVTYQLKGGVVQEADSSEVESITIFETLNHLPDEVKNLKSIIFWGKAKKISGHFYRIKPSLQKKSKVRI